MQGFGRAGKLAAQPDHLIVKQLEALDLNGGAGETIEHHAVPELRLEELVEEQAEHLLVPHHAAARLDRPRLRGVQQLADHDGRRSDAADPADEGGVRSLTGAGRTSEQNELLGEKQVFPAELFLQSFPNPVENQLGILDFKIGTQDGDGGLARIHWRGLHYIEGPRSRAS